MIKTNKQLSPEELHGKMEMHEDFILVDVLSSKDYHTAHIQGAVNIPLEELVQKANQWLNRHVDIIVYSANGHCRGAEFAQEKLGKMGFRAWKLNGGLEEWMKEQYPIEGNPNHKPALITQKPNWPEETPKTVEEKPQAQEPKVHEEPGPKKKAA